MNGDKTKHGYEVWFGFSDEMLVAVGAALRGATYEVTRRSEYRQYGEYARWTETRPIKWSIRWSPDLWGGCWVLYVSAQAAIHEAERLATRAVRERLQPGTRVRLAHHFHSLGGETRQAGLPGWVDEVDWQRGVSVLFDGIPTEGSGFDIGKFWVVPIKDTPTTPKAKAGGIYRDERSVR